MQRFIHASVLGVVLVASHLLAAGVASADGGGAVGLLAETVTTTVGDTGTTASDSIAIEASAELDLSASDGAVADASVDVAVADQPVLAAEATVASSEASLASVEADASVADGAVLDAAVDATLVGEGGLVSADSEASLGDGQVLNAAIDATVAGNDGILDATVTASTGAGELLDASAETTVLGDSPLSVTLDAGAGGQDVNAGAELSAGAILPEPEATTPVVPTSAVSDAPTIVQAGLPTETPSPTIASTAPRSVELPARGAAHTRTAAAPISEPSPVTLDARGTWLSSERPAREHTITSAADGAAQSLAQALGAVAITASTSFSGPFHRDGMLAVTAASAALAAALLLLLGRRDLFRLPASRVCLPPVPPG